MVPGKWVRGNREASRELGAKPSYLQASTFARPLTTLQAVRRLRYANGRFAA
jgi:hypothetical protein